jgi:hypothetical protein
MHSRGCEFSELAVQTTIETYMSLFTFILEFRGGTYISQYKGRTLKDACKKWVVNVEPDTVFGLGIKGKQSLANQIADSLPVPISGAHNVWCATASIHGKLCFVNIVRTDNTISINSSK